MQTYRFNLAELKRKSVHDPSISVGKTHINFDPKIRMKYENDRCILPDLPFVTMKRSITFSVNIRELEEFCTNKQIQPNSLRLSEKDRTAIIEFIKRVAKEEAESNNRLSIQYAKRNLSNDEWLDWQSIQADIQANKYDFAIDRMNHFDQQLEDLNFEALTEDDLEKEHQRRGEEEKAKADYQAKLRQLVSNVERNMNPKGWWDQHCSPHHFQDRSGRLVR